MNTSANADNNNMTIPNIDAATTPRSINKIAIIGSGTMGGGIAM